jgi:pilus assembly protein CpaE
VTLILESDGHLATTLAFTLGDEPHHVETPAAATRHVGDHPDELLVVVGPTVDLAQALGLAATWRLDRPDLGVVLLRHRIDVQVLAQALRAGVREVVNPDDLGAVVEATRRSVEISRRRTSNHPATAGERRPEGKVVTVFSAKGGCGKTTVATNLAGALAADGVTTVCVLDLDLEFGDVAITLQLTPERTVVDAVPMLGTMDEQGLRSVVTAHSPGLDAVLAPAGPGEVSQVEARMVPELVRVLRRMYDVVVIDTPPAFTEHVLASFDVSDAYLLLATLDVPALKNLKLSLETLAVLGYPRESVLVVLNRADARVGLEVSDVERTLGTAVTVQIPSSGDVPAAVNRGVLIATQSPDHPVSRAVRQLADLVVDRRTSRAHAIRSRPGGLRGLLRRGVR